MKIRTKAIWGLVILSAVVLAANGVILYHLRREFSADRAQREQEQRLEAYLEVRDALGALLTPLRESLLRAEPGQERRFRKAYDSLSSRISSLRRRTPAGGETETLDALEVHLSKIEALEREIFALPNPMTSPRTSRLTRSLGALSAQAMEISQRLTSELEQARREMDETRETVRRRLFRTLLAAACLLIGGGLFGVIYFSRVLSHPLLELVRAARRISEGDFTTRLDARRKDEFGRVHHSFNYMLDALDEREQALVRKNRELKELVQELESSNEERQLANEEMESANEELQISNEELESTNEELNLSNQELETKSRELSEARELLEERNRELREAHDSLESVIRSTNSGICVIGRDYRIESVNPALEQILGYGASEMIGAFCYRIFHQSAEPCPDCPAQHTFAQGATARYQHRHVGRDRGERILDITTTPLFGADNRLARVIETINDVTEITKLAQELREQKEWTGSILFHMGEGVSVIRDNYEIEFVNNALKQRFGEIAGQKCFHAFRGFSEPCPGEPCSLQELLVKGKKRFEVTKAAEDGRYYRMTSVPLQNPDGTFSMIQIRQDVTDQQKLVEEKKRYTEQLETMNRRMQEEVEKQTLELRNANTELRLANERLKELNREKSDFIDIAVHDLRTPLTSILSYADILRKYQDEPPETQAEFLEIIIQESFRMKRLIDDYLDLSKLEAGFVDFEEEEVHLPDIVAEIFSAFEARAAAKGIRLDRALPPTLPPITADANRIRQVFSNLIDNALKYTPEGGEVMVSGELLEKERLLRFTVRDSGIGMDSKDHALLFHKFERVPDRRVRREQGSGLGLSIVKTIVEHYGGGIEVKSRKGEGSRFVFTLPLDRGVTPARHAIAVCRDASAMVREIGPLWKECLERNYACAFFGAPRDIDIVKETLTAQALNPYDLMDREQIILSPARDPLLKNGACNGEHLYACASTFCDRIMSSPRSGLLLVRDMTRLMSGEESGQEVLYFEKRWDRYLRGLRKPVIQICRYDPEGFTNLEMDNLVNLHPYRLTEGKIVAGSA